ncbi:EcsC family protein [Metabacillus sediminilitoris]|uniref:EcsC family protein n=1 Tax=Metabacillus sediminilitoris TaxID=2567941 RepID=A0A4S4C4A9_9BACI|nr:EcsC family protein [Metabacillus sediminilitoris]QGQ47518.1 EcsC family protein [Metabacillus sediminilitoris]THF81952.1 EcsC family protein [Metabacillus sediminilitoris]
MNKTVRQKTILNEISLWEQELQNDVRTDLGRTFDRWIKRKLDEIPDSMKQIFFEKLDASLFNLHSFIQNSLIQQDAKKQILLSAKALNEEIFQINDLHKLHIDQLHYLADLQTSKHRLYSFIQGGLTGTGGILLTGIDIPIQTILNLRSIQMVSMCYGYEINNPYEMMTSLKVYHASLLPKHLQYNQWHELKKEIDSDDDIFYFYEGKEDLSNRNSLEYIVKQVAKLSVLSLFKRKLVAGLPLVSMMIGAGMNYQHTRRITEFANKYYQYRFINDKSH